MTSFKKNETSLSVGKKKGKKTQVKGNIFFSKII